MSSMIPFESKIIIEDPPIRRAIVPDEALEIAWKHLANSVPRVVSALSEIATCNARTKDEIALIEAGGKRLLLEADAFARQSAEYRTSIQEAGTQVVQILNQTRGMLADQNIPEEARSKIAAHLHEWITEVVRARSK